jgi:hypothetical protein
MKNQQSIIQEVLSLEHRNMARKLRLIRGEQELVSADLLTRTVRLLDELTIAPQEDDKKTAIMVSAILWSYRQPQTEGLRDYLIKIFSRIGFSPSSIMVDDGYDGETKSYSPVYSYIDQITIAAHQFKNEIELDGITYLLTDFQYSVWSSMSTNKLVGVSAPTSAGKSFIIALKTIELLRKNNGVVIYIVPTISLVSQVTVDYRRLLKQHGINHVQIVNTYDHDESPDDKIYVMTQEKAIAAFSHDEVPFKNLLLLVIDEIQNVERVGNEDDQRAKTLYDLIVEFRTQCDPKHIVISGPRISRIGALGNELIGLEAVEQSTMNSPVCNLTYSILKTKKRSFFKQYSGIISNPLSLPIEDDSNIPKPGTQYTVPVHELIFELIENLGKDSINIIFSPTSGQSETTAKYLADKSGITDVPNERLESLIDYIKRTVHPQYTLTDVLGAGMTFHHGKMPHHVRRTVEHAINEKLLNNVICTTTLMQGVNLPAQNVIIRNPNLFTRKKDGQDSELTDYELANLRGRAGRLLKDFLGRTIILEEEKFDRADEKNLFSETTKELTSGYERIFKVHKQAIVDDLENQVRPSNQNRQHAFLLTYIRQTAVRHPYTFVQRLADVGIKLSESQIRRIAGSVSNLRVPLKVCLRNRYWDPLVLNDLFLEQKSFNLPISGNDRFLAVKLEATIEKLRELTPFYVEKYFDIVNTPNARLLTSACISAGHWLNEQPLVEILSSGWYDDAEKIRKGINQLQGMISHQLPALLQPIYDCIQPDSSFLRFIELGAYQPVTRRLIEHSIARETAIILRKDYFQDLRKADFDFRSDILPILRKNFRRMEYWVQVQLEVLF